MGSTESVAVGILVGIAVGEPVGVGALVGIAVGESVKYRHIQLVGTKDGTLVGCAVGDVVSHWKTTVILSKRATLGPSTQPCLPDVLSSRTKDVAPW